MNPTRNISIQHVDESKKR